MELTILVFSDFSFENSARVQKWYDNIVLSIDPIFAGYPCSLAGVHGGS
jgi:hypothetical protein